MKREYPEHPLVGVGAVIVEGDRVVLVRRAAEPMAGQWSIPGGLLELGETMRAGAEREAREETGLQVEAGEVLGVLDRIVPDGDGKPRFHYVLIDFLCRRVAGELRAGGDAAETRWVREPELAGLGVAEAATRIIRHAIQRASAVSITRLPDPPITR
jgi:ADP-ribose pyrophosphatase YjhB (NUDIX family)